MSHAEVPELSSPACFAHEADDAYMGYMSTGELRMWLMCLLALERAHEGALTRLDTHGVSPENAVAGAERVVESAISAIEALVRPSQGAASASSDQQLGGSMADRAYSAEDGQVALAHHIRQALPKVRDDRIGALLLGIALGHERTAALFTGAR